MAIGVPSYASAHSERNVREINLRQASLLINTNAVYKVAALIKPRRPSGLRASPTGMLGYLRILSFAICALVNFRVFISGFSVVDPRKCSEFISTLSR